MPKTTWDADSAQRIMTKLKRTIGKGWQWPRGHWPRVYFGATQYISCQSRLYSHGSTKDKKSDLFVRFRKKGSRLKLEIWFWIYFLLFLYSQLPAWWRGSWEDWVGIRIITGIPNLLSVLFKGLYPYRCVAFSVRVWIFTYFPILWLFVIYPSP